MQNIFRQSICSIISLKFYSVAAFDDLPYTCVPVSSLKEYSVDIANTGSLR